MSYDLTKPESREETYLAKMTNDYSGTLPDPIARVDFYLKKLAEMGGGGGISVYVTGCNINNDGDLIVTLSNGSTINAGRAKGDTGAQGEKGEPGASGQDGADGQDGKSAYEIWQDAGNSGTESDFIASLKGDPGEDGETPDISTVENTVEALAAGLADSGVVQLGSEYYGSGTNLDETGTKVYYRKIGALVALCGVLKWTNTPMSLGFITLPDELHPCTTVPIFAIGAKTGTSAFMLSESGVMSGGAFGSTSDYTESCYFSATYATSEDTASASSLLQALQDLVEVN